MLRTLLSAILLIVLSNNAYSYDLNCPVVDQNVQVFCSSEGIGNDFHLPRISDLVAEDGGDGIAWYDSIDSQVALDPGQLLENDKLYYADNSTGTCGSRVAVSVTINDAPNAGATTFVSLCSNGDPVDLLTLYKPSILGPPDADGIFSPALVSGTTVFDPTIDNAGQYRYIVISQSGSCPPDDSYIYISINSAPNAGEDAAVTISNTDFPLDLFTVLGGSPDIGGEWTPSLNSGSGIFDPAVDSFGEYRYTVTNDKLCSDYAVITVFNLSDPLPQPCPLVSNTSQVFCSSEGTGNNFHKPRISDLVAEDGGGGIAWYDSLDSQVALDPGQLLGDGKLYYADNSTGTCGSRVAVSVTINDAPNAGATTFVSLCSNGDPVDLLTLYKPSILGPPDTGGIFSPALASGTTVFDPTVDNAGQYRYIVTSQSGLCPTDDSYIYISINSAPNAGEDSAVTLSNTDIPIDLFTVLGGSPDLGGEWTPSLNSGSGIFDPAVDSFGEYRYTVTNDELCSDYAVITVFNLSDPLPQPCPLVSNTSQVFCSSEGTGNNFHKPRISDLVAQDDGGGIAWYSTSSSVDILSDDHLLESGNQYYAGNASGTCKARIAVTVTINAAPNAGATTFVTLCSDDAAVDLLTLYNPSILGPPDTGGIFYPPLASGSTIFDPAVDNSGRYQYRVSSINSCPADDSYIYITVEDCTTKIASHIEVSIFPNPSYGIFDTQSRNHSTIKMITLYDFNGKKLKELYKKTDENEMQIDLTGYKAGMYFAEIKTSEGIVVKKLIKQ